MALLNVGGMTGMEKLQYQVFKVVLLGLAVLSFEFEFD
jgi:hypothetical protein